MKKCCINSMIPCLCVTHHKIILKMGLQIEQSDNTSTFSSPSWQYWKIIPLHLIIKEISLAPVLYKINDINMENKQVFYNILDTWIPCTTENSKNISILTVSHFVEFTSYRFCTNQHILLFSQNEIINFICNSISYMLYVNTLVI